MGVLASSTSNNETLINNSYASCTWVPTTFGTTANHGVPPVTNTTPFAAVRSFATYFHNVQLSTSNGQGGTPPFNNMDGIVQQTLSSSGCCFVLDHVSVTGYHEAIAASGQPNGANNPLITGGSWIAGNDYGLVAGLGASWTVEGASVFQENYFGNYKFLSGSALIKGTYTEMDFASSGNSAGYGLQAGDNTNPCLLSGNCAAPQVDFSNNYVQCSGYTGTTGHYIIEAQVAVRSKFDYNNLTNCGSQGFLDDLQTNATAGIEVVGNQFHSGGPPTWFPAGTTGVCFTDVASTNLGLTGCPNWWNVGTVNATNLLLNGLPVGTVTLNELFPQGGLPGGAINVPTTSVLIFGLDSPANLAFSNIETYVASGSGTADVGFYLGAPGGTCTLLGDIATGGAGKSFSGINASVPYAVTQGIETIPAGRYWVAVTAATGSTLAIHGNATATYGYSAAWTPSGYVGGSGVLPSGGTCPARNVALGNSLPAIWPF